MSIHFFATHDVGRGIRFSPSDGAGTEGSYKRKECGWIETVKEGGEVLLGTVKREWHQGRLVRVLIVGQQCMTNLNSPRTNQH